jgi:signal transduction histidine kinase
MVALKQGSSHTMVATHTPDSEASMALLPNNIPQLLIIDDEPTNHEIMRRIFDADYVIHEARSGQGGIDRLADNAYDVVLLDIVLPDMDGFDVLKQIRDTPETADLPVIMMSGITDAEFVARGLNEGANDYITKPLNETITRARVKTQLQLKKLSDERKRTIEQLQQLTELRDHLFKIASHDLKNPLSNLRLAHQEIQYLVPDNPEIETLQAIMEVSLNDMQTMIEDFMDAAALQNGKLDVQPDCVELSGNLIYVVNQYEAGAERKNIRLELARPDMLVLADSQRLTQVIANLVSNAIKYSPENTTVKVWAERRDNQRARLFIADEGPGVPEKERPLLFQEFSKLSPRPTGGESSTGLGLWIVRQLAEMMNGSAGVDFPTGGGSTFWVDLPVCQTNYQTTE